MLKRLFDLLAAGAGLLVLAPLFALLALLITLDSSGPVFYRQWRVGLHGRHFRIFKFRTMSVDQAPGAAEITVAGDSRITRTGGWLRRWKLDELPQLIDVLRGTMSLVGPRPEVPRYVAHYPPALRERALAVRPGITDPASLEFIDEATLLAQAADPEREYIEVILPAKLRRAADYAESASLATDVALLWRTLRVLLTKGR